MLASLSPDSEEGDLSTVEPFGPDADANFCVSLSLGPDADADFCVSLSLGPDADADFCLSLSLGPDADADRDFTWVHLGLVV